MATTVHDALVRPLVVIAALAVAGCGSGGGESQKGKVDTVVSVVPASTASETALTVSTPETDTEPTPTTATAAVSTSATNSTDPETTMASVVNQPQFPTKEAISADLDPHCDRLYAVVAKMDLGSNVPYVAKAMGFDDGTDRKGGCEMYFDGGSAVDGIRDGTFSIAWTDVPMAHREPTNDPDEVEVTLTSGAKAKVDPTGDDGAGYDDVRVVSVLYPDGAVAFVVGFKGTSVEATLAVADEFDRVVQMTR